MDLPNFIHFECPDCGFTSIQHIDFAGNNLCPLCHMDSGHDVKMRRRPAKQEDKVEGHDARNSSSR